MTYTADPNHMITLKAMSNQEDMQDDMSVLVLPGSHLDNDDNNNNIELKSDTERIHDVAKNLNNGNTHFNEQKEEKEEKEEKVKAIMSLMPFPNLRFLRFDASVSGNSGQRSGLYSMLQHWNPDFAGLNRLSQLRKISGNYEHFMHLESAPAILHKVEYLEWGSHAKQRGNRTMLLRCFPKLKRLRLNRYQVFDVIVPNRVETLILKRH